MRCASSILKRNGKGWRYIILLPAKESRVLGCWREEQIVAGLVEIAGN